MNIFLKLLILFLKFLKYKLSKYAYYFDLLLAILEPTVIIIGIKNLINDLKKEGYINVELIKTYLRKIIETNLIMIEEILLPNIENFILKLWGEKALEFFKFQFYMSIKFVLTLSYFELLLWEKIKSSLTAITSKIESIKTSLLDIFK